MIVVNCLYLVVVLNVKLASEPDIQFCSIEIHDIYVCVIVHISLLPFDLYIWNCCQNPRFKCVSTYSRVRERIFANCTHIGVSSENLEVDRGKN